MASCLMKELAFKTLFLVAITLVHRVSELGALSVDKALCVFHNNKVVLRPDPAFVPEVNSFFPRTQDIALPSFCPKPKHSKERELHFLDLCRALSFYIDRSRRVRKTDSLFIYFRKSSEGTKVSSQMLGR